MVFASIHWKVGRSKKNSIFQMKLLLENYLRNVALLFWDCKKLKKKLSFLLLKKKGNILIS